MLKLERQNKRNCNKVLNKLPYNVFEILGHEIFENGIEEHRILYAGIVYIIRKQAVLLNILVIALAIFVNKLILPILGVALGVISLVVSIDLLVRLLINNKKYYIFVLDDSISLIPFSNPAKFVKLPKDRIALVIVKRHLLSSGQIKIAVDDFARVDQSSNSVFNETFGIERGIVNQYSGNAKNIQHALLSSMYSDKIKS